MITDQVRDSRITKLLELVSGEAHGGKNTADRRRVDI